jgi:hypothetical protein
MSPDALSSAQEQAALSCIVLTLSYLFFMYLCLILPFLSFYPLSFYSILFLPLPLSAIFHCPIIFLLLLPYICSLFFYLSFYSILFLPLPLSAIFHCPIIFLLLLPYICSLFFYRFIIINSCHFLFLKITVFLNIIICFKLFRLPLLLPLCLLMPPVQLICILTRIYLHDLLLFIMFHLLVCPYYSFFVI